MTTPLVTAVAPVPPGRIGRPIAAEDVLRYLERLGDWRDQRRIELDQLDAAALAAPDGESLTGDVTLSMALWQAVAARYDQLVAVWDSGRVTSEDRERISALVWGRLDTSDAAGALQVSLPEACRLSDALAGQLRMRLALDPLGVEVSARLRALRAQVERVRDLADHEPAGPAYDAVETLLRRLDVRLAEVSERAGRGADVGGLLGPLESDAARAERDLIVGSATRRDTERDAERAREIRASLERAADEVAVLARECVAQVRPAPRLAVPQVGALGPVPTERAALDAYLVRLDAVSRALSVARDAYSSAIAERESLRGQLDGYRAMASATPGSSTSSGGSGTASRADDPEVAALYAAARGLLEQRPTDVRRARAAVAAYQALVREPGRPGRTP